MVDFDSNVQRELFECLLQELDQPLEFCHVQEIPQSKQRVFYAVDQNNDTQDLTQLEGRECMQDVFIYDEADIRGSVKTNIASEFESSIKNINGAHVSAVKMTFQEFRKRIAITLCYLVL